MRLSDVKGARTLEVIAEIIDPVASIAQDPEAMQLFKRVKLPDGADPRKFVVDRLRSNAPKLLKGHSGDIIAILAAIEGVSADQYAANLNLSVLVKDLIELLSDHAFTELFISAQNGNGSGSAQVNTEVPKQ